MKNKLKYLINGILAALPLLPLSCAMGAEDDLYDFLWLDPDKTVYVLQNKEFAKTRTWYLDVGFLKGQSSDYQSTNGFNVNMGYFFSEEWGVELIYNMYRNKDNESMQNLRRINGVVPFMRMLDNSYGAAAVWSPFYGKINTFNKIFYFDLNFGLGAMQVNANSNAESAANPLSNEFKDESFNAALLKVAFRFHVNQHLHLGVELQNTYFKAYGPVRSEGKQLNTFTDAVFKIGISF